MSPSILHIIVCVLAVFALRAGLGHAQIACVNASAVTGLAYTGPVIAPPSNYYTTYVGTGYWFQSKPVWFPHSFHVTGVALFPFTGMTGTLTLRGAIYDAANSTLLAQSDTVTVAATGYTVNALTPVWLNFTVPATLSVGYYSVAYWAAASSNQAAGSITVFATTSTSATYLGATSSTGAFPTFLAAYNTFGDGTFAPLLQIMGSTCDNDMARPAIDLSSSIASIVTTIKNKYNTAPALGAMVIESPLSVINRSMSSLVTDTVCPYLALGSAVSGVRRADAVIPEPVTIGDEWHLGSDTKSMTAVLVQQLIESGRLALNTTVMQVFNRFSNGSCTCATLAANTGYFAKSNYTCNLIVHTSWTYVTVAHLLTHSAGLQALDTLFAGGNPINNMERTLESAALNETCTNYPLPSRRYHLQQLLTLAIPNPPSSVNTPVAYAYSNNHFILLGLIVEELLTTPWESVMQQQLFAPLGVTTGGYGSPQSAIPLNSHAAQPFGHYVDSDGTHSTASDNPKSWGPAGTAHMSMTDWARFLACHLQEGRALAPAVPSRGSPLLNTSTWKAVHTAYTFPGSTTPNSQYTLSGTFAYTDVVGFTIEHQGSNTLWIADFWAHPSLAQPAAVLVVANLEDQNVNGEALMAVTNAYLSWLMQTHNTSSSAASTSSSSSSTSIPATSTSSVNTSSTGGSAPLPNKAGPQVHTSVALIALVALLLNIHW